jgi:hypothetical protein
MLTLSPIVLWSVATVVASISIASTIAMVRTAARNRPAEVRPAPAWLLGAGAFAIVCGASLFTVDRWAFSHPFWDAWHDGQELLKPFVQGRLRFLDLFAPHNEHRIALTRLWSLVFFRLDGLWDNRTITTANTVLHALAVGVLVTALGLRHRARDAWLLALVLVIPASLPLAMDDLLFGFQSQFYFLLLYAPTALWLLTHCKPASAGFALGALCGTLALFSVGSGPVAAFALLATIVLEALCDRSTIGTRAPAALVALLLAIAGWRLRVHVDYLDAAHAKNAWELLRLALRCWSFPWTHSIAPSVLLWAPSLLWLVGLVRQRRAWTNDERFLAALGVFIFVHAPMIGWARANDSPWPANRYFDVLSLGLLVNALALVALSPRWPLRRRRVCLAAWLLVAATGLAWQADYIYVNELPYHEAMWTLQQHHVRGYVDTGDPVWLEHNEPWEIPHWSTEILRTELDDPFIRSILPSSVRKPLAVEILDGADSVFSSPGLPPDPYRSPPGVIADWQKVKTLHHSPRVHVRVAATTFPFLRFGVVGEARRGPHTLTLESADERIPVTLPATSPMHEWTAVTARAPRGPFTVEATSTDWYLWWGFSAPTEAGPLSGRVDNYVRVAKYGMLGLGLLLWLGAWLTSRRLASRSLPSRSS